MNKLLSNSLDQINDWKKFSNTQKKIKKHFKFLFQHGFIVVYKNHQPEHMGYWEVVLLSDDCAIKIYEERGWINTELGTVKMDDWAGLGTVVFYITNGQEFIENFTGDMREKDEQLIRLANIIEKYIEPISAMFKDLGRHKPELLAVRDTVIDLYKAQYANRDDLLKYVAKRKRK